MTFVEMLVTIAILSIMSVALAKIFTDFYKTNDFALEQSEAVDSARSGVSSAMQDLREATYGDDGSYPVLSAATSSITFFSNIDKDTSIEKVRYYLSGGTLYRGITNATSTPPTYAGQSETSSIIAAYVQNASTSPATSVFTYFDSSGNQLSAPFDISDIASVRTSVLIDVDTNRSPATFTLSESATLRNLRAH